MRSVHRTSCPAPTGRARGSRPLDAPRSAGPPASGRGDDEDEVPALDLLVPRDREPLDGAADRAVMLASIFIASIVATTPPGSTTSSATVGVTTPANGADVPGIRGVRLSAALTSADTERSRTCTGRNWPLRVHMTVRMPCRSASPTELRPQQALARLDLRLVLAAVHEPVEELDGAEHGEVAETLPAVLELLRRAREEQVVQGAPRVGAQRLLLLRRQLGRARLGLAALQRLGAERLGQPRAVLELLPRGSR